jgi:hypothetical protein
MSKFLVRNWLPPFLLATMLAIGTTCVWAVAIVWTVSVVENLFTEPAGSPSLAITVDGRALWQTYRPGGYQEITYRTLDGQVVEPAAVEVQNYQSVLRCDERPAGPLQWWQRVAGFGQPRGRAANWYLLYDGQEHGHAYFVGFDIQSRRTIGYLGLRGFRAEAPPRDEWFDIDSRLTLSGGATAGEWSSAGTEPRGANAETVPVVYVVSKGLLFQVDLQRQSVEPVALPDKVLFIGNGTEPVAVEDDRKIVFKPRVLIRLRDRVLWMNLEGEQLRTIALPSEVQHANLTAYGTTAGEAVLVASKSDWWLSQRDIYWIDSNGSVVRREQLDLNQPASSNAQRLWLMSGVVPSPFVPLLGVFVFLPTNDRLRDESLDYRAALAQSLAEGWPPLVAVCLFSTVLAALGYRRHCRYSKTGALAWAVFILVLGLPGLVGYWLHRRWPVKERCPECGSVVPRDRENCLQCAAGFPTPALKGIEVFA